MSFRHLPNLLSFSRMLLVIPVAMAISQQRFRVALWMVLLAALTDLLDGQLARRLDWRSRLGSFLDPTADKLLVFALYLVFWDLGLLPPALVFTILLRDFIIVGGVLMIYLRNRQFESSPSAVSKLSTAMSYVLAIAVLVSVDGGDLPAWALLWLGALTWVVSVVSGCHYIIARRSYGFGGST